MIAQGSFLSGRTFADETMPGADASRSVSAAGAGARVDRILAEFARVARLTGAGKVGARLPDAGAVVGARRLPAGILAALRDADEFDDQVGREVFRRRRDGIETVNRIAATFLLAGEAPTLRPARFSVLSWHVDVNGTTAEFDPPHAADETRRGANVVVDSAGDINGH